MVSQSAIHAIRALAALATGPGDEFVGAAELASRIDAPPNYLSKLLQTLARTGLVETRKGAGGGVRLARQPARIRLIDIVSELEPAVGFEGCFLGGRVCSESEPCGVHERWKALTAQFELLLHTTTIRDLIRDDQAPSGARRS